jgi:hypothetical protein
MGPMMGRKEDVRLRDVRKPGHCWQDNELYDVFQPIIGVNGVSVYVHLTRNATGSQASGSLRELASRTGLGKDTVRRALLGMLEIGMLRQPEDGVYELVDLKELCEHYGAAFAWQQRSYLLAEAKIAELRARVVSVHAQTQGKTPAPQKTAAPVRVEPSTVSQRDNAAVSERDTSVPGERQNCLSERHASSYTYTKTKTSTNTPLPPSRQAAKGERDEDDPDGEIAEAVATAVGVADKREARRLREVLRKVIAWERANGGLQGEELQIALVEAWSDYSQAAPQLRWTYAKQSRFYGCGLWRDPGRWPVNRTDRAMSTEATVGMYRGPS